MTKYIFSIEKSQKLVSNDNPDLKRIKLKSLNGNSEIEFCYTNFGTCSIYKDIQDQNKDKVLCWISDNTHHSCTSERMLKRDFDLNNTEAKVVLDDNCEYRISLSDTSNGTHVILPRSLILNKNLNLKDYYNKEIRLVKGEKVSSATEDFECYTPKITYEGRKICELDPIFVAYNSEAFTYRVPKSEGFYEYKPSRPIYIAIEKKDNELLAYFADHYGNPIDMLGEHAIGIDSIDKKNFNTHLRSELLEHSNIREVLPELREVLPEVNVDNSLCSDTRQLSCWINKASTIQKIATDESFKNSVKDLLKIDPGFINSVKGERGRKGEDASPEEVVRKWADDSSKRYILSQEIVKNENFQKAVKSLLNRDTQFKGEVRDLLKSDKGFRDSVKGKEGESPPVNAVAQELITTKANELGQAILSVKHDDREILANNQVLQQGVAAQLMNDDNRNTLVTEVAKNEDLQKSVAGNQDLRNAVAINLKKDETFQTTVKGDPGKDGKSPPVDAVAQELITNKVNELGQAVLEAKDDEGKEILVNNPDLQEGVAEKLRENPGKTKGEQGEPGLEGKPGKDGVQGPKGDKGDNNAQQNFALQKGEKLLDDVYEANIVLNDKTIATLPKIGYYTLNDQLVVHNHVTREKVVIPEEFHYLKVVRLGSGFGDSDYKLTFCNVLGNEFFEYKKYDPEYSRVPDEYKFISLSHAKKEYNPNLSELISHQPLFFIKKGPAEPGSDKYAAAVFELTHNGKGKKMATLIDEFGYFDQNGMFKHCNYHEETKCRSYTSAEIDKEYQVTDADSEFYLTEHDNVIIHTIPEL